MATAALSYTALAQSLHTRLLPWFDLHQRALPWRQTTDPYRIWISEIMLQQTRVAAVLDYYAAFLRRFPDVQSLAAADENDVIAAWSGLGYYRRARMLHAAAKQIAFERNNTFPATSLELRELPGIGRYTAAAIASIAFAEPVAVLDGNVERVLLRLLGAPLSSAEAWSAANALLAPSRPADWNQAMMELGALVCTPKSPRCLECPLLDLCATRGEHVVAPRPARQRKQVSCLLRRRRGRVLLHQRPLRATLMPGMWELPQVSDADGEALIRLKHSITNTDYEVRVFASGTPTGKDLQRWFTPAALTSAPLTGLTRKVLRRLNILESKR